MLMHSIPLLVLAFLGFLLLWPISRKPLSEDEGNWYYLSVFRKSGLRPFKNYSLGGFDVKYIASLFFNIIPGNNIAALQYFKILWYTLTSISVYVLSLAFWHDTTLSFLAGLLFLIIVAVPNTFFTITYAEHFLILPANLSLTCAYIGVTQNSIPLIFASGILSSWMYQMKPPPAIIFSIALTAIFPYGSNPISYFCWYALGFLSLMIVPMGIAFRNGEESRRCYLQNNFAVYLIVLLHIAKRLNWISIEAALNRLGKFIEISDQGVAYLDRNLSRHSGLKQVWMEIKANTYPFCKDLYLVLVLATLTTIGMIVNFDYRVLMFLGLFVTFFAMIYVQKNFYTPHFSPIWSPLSILAAKAIWDFWPYHSTNRALGWAMIAFICLGSYKIIKIIIKSFSRSESDSFGYLDPLFGKVYRLCETIGKYIRENSNENEKLLVWGDQPTIYLHARREIFDMNYIFIYAHNEKIVAEKELLKGLRNNPPELLIFYNYKVLDGWNIKRLQETIGIPYDHMKSFQVTDDSRKNEKNPQGICFDFPLYRRDDTKYKEILLDRALVAEMNEDANETRLQLENILEIFPEDYEASVRLSLLENDTNGSKATQSYLERKLAENHDSIKNAILLRLLAEIDIDAGNLDSAGRNYKKALNSNPNDFRIHNGLGELYFSIDRIEDALESFKKAIELHPYSSDVLNNIGVLLSQSDKRDDAIKYFQKALSFMPSHPDAQKNINALGT